MLAASHSPSEGINDLLAVTASVLGGAKGPTALKGRDFAGPQEAGPFTFELRGGEKTFLGANRPGQPTRIG